MAEHVNTQHVDTHEPRHITISTTADTGKVITPSATTSGESELRQLDSTEIQKKRIAVTAHFNDITTGAIDSTWVVSPVTGDIVAIDSVIHTDITTANEIITCRIGGVAIATGTITIDFSGSAAGDSDRVIPTGSNTVTAGQPIQAQSSQLSTAGTGGVTPATITYYIVESV
jgi:hypothetical protein